MYAPGAGRFSKSLSKSGKVSGANSFVEYPRASGATVPEQWSNDLPNDFRWRRVGVMKGGRT